MSPQSNPKKGRKRKAPSTCERISTNYPVLDYGSLASAIELKRSEGYDWVFPKTSNTGILSQFRVNKCLGLLLHRSPSYDRRTEEVFSMHKAKYSSVAPHYFETKS